MPSVSTHTVSIGVQPPGVGQQHHPHAGRRQLWDAGTSQVCALFHRLHVDQHGQRPLTLLRLHPEPTRRVHPADQGVCTGN